MEVSELLDRYQEGKRKFPWIDLEGRSLSGAQLPGVSFLRGKLAGVDLSGANLARSHLFKADLQGANLQGASLIAVNFGKANLTGANLRDADLTDAILAGTILDNADLTGAILPKDPTPPPTQETELETEIPEPEPPSMTPPLPLEETSSEVNAYNDEDFAYRMGWHGKAFYDRLPRTSLGALVLGYAIAGGLFQAYLLPLSAIAAWVIATAWVFDDAWTWFPSLFVSISLPMALMSGGLMVWVQAIPAIVVAMISFFNLKGWGYTGYRSLKGSLFFAGLTLAGLVNITLLMGVTQGGISLEFFLLFLSAVLSIGAGMPSWMTMRHVGYNRRQTLKTMAIASGVGLVGGWVLAWMF